ncbi:ribosome hibernation-promoting factor, HPF/YfiA family [Chamaesiphon minutus]|uniref:Ribosome hibernation promoting factor n=1 Tax=Chamaesiphon minutus (strain ATCC 27169 / PCC 6605) TaxID=1173020 RepID=K9UAQ1_CHAP6|nr:ribosome-associated translation inhibitor RaiA [Chamaesiphon minutus]AFY91915.1 ribosomal subunit interface protein [Chamaesiphon minutus PCC 6605]
MKLVLQSKNIEITDAIRDYVNQKIEKAVSHFEQITTEIDINLSVAKNPRIAAAQVAEVTIYVNGAVIRAEEASEHLYASIDLVADKISRKLRKYKERNFTKKDRTEGLKDIGEELDLELLDYNLTDNRSATLPAEVVRTKYFALSALTIEEAMAQLQLVDHDFYVYRSVETGEVNVVYRRNHGGFGVIQPRPGSNEKNGYDRPGRIGNAKEAV